jgi:hypothetical protein
VNTTIGASKKDKGIGLQGDPLRGRVVHAFFVARRPGGWGSWCFHAPGSAQAKKTALLAATALTNSHNDAPAAAAHHVITLSRSGADKWQAACPCSWTSTGHSTRGSAQETGAVHWDRVHSSWAPGPDDRDSNGTVKVRVGPEAQQRLPSRFTAEVKSRGNGRIALLVDGKSVRAKVDLPPAAARHLAGGLVRFKVTKRSGKDPDTVMPLLYQGSDLLRKVRAAVVAAGRNPGQLDELASPRPKPRKDSGIVAPRRGKRRTPR